MVIIRHLFSCFHTHVCVCECMESFLCIFVCLWVCVRPYMAGVRTHMYAFAHVNACEDTS